MATSYRIQIQNVLISAALASTGFSEVTYDTTTGLATDTGTSVTPVGAYSNEIRATYRKPRLNRQGGPKRERDEWAFDLLLLFDREVSSEQFEDEVAGTSLQVLRDANHTRQINLHLREVNYEHPPNQDSGNGSKMRFVFSAEMSPV